MQTYDLVMLAVLAGATLFGYWKGLAWQIASLGSIVLSYFVALNFRGLIASKLGLQPPLDTAAAMLILYVGCSLAVWIGFGFISKSLKEMKLKDWDHQIGALVGAAKGVLFCMLITVFSMTLLPKNVKDAICGSRSGRYIAAGLAKSEAFLPKDIHQTIAKYIDPVEAELSSGELSLNTADDGLLGLEGKGGDLLGDIKKAGSEFVSKAKQVVSNEVESQAKEGAEKFVRDFSESVSRNMPASSGSTGATFPEAGRDVQPLDGDGNLSPLGAPRAPDAGRPSVRMPDFSSKRWKRK